jgi:hypothetical protein
VGNFDWFLIDFFIIQETLECGDSCSNTSINNTLTSKSSVKRSYESVDPRDVIVVEIGDASATKPHILVSVKVEPSEWNSGKIVMWSTV